MEFGVFIVARCGGDAVWRIAWRVGMGSKFGCLLCLGTLVITALTVPGRPGRWVGRAFWSGGERL